MKNRQWLWFPAVGAAAILQTAGGIPWQDTALTALAAFALSCLPRPEVQPGWMEWLRSAWNGVILAKVLFWLAGYWPEAPIWVAGTALVLALWLSGGQAEGQAAAGSVLGLFQLVLAGAVLLSAVPEVHSENWAWQKPTGNGWLLAALLLPETEEKSGRIGAGLWAVLISLITAGAVKNDGYYEMSKSVSLFGSIRRLESLAAVGLTLGFLLLSGELLKSGRKERSLLTAGTAAVLFLTGWYPTAAAAGIGSAIVWVLLPYLASVRKGGAAA